VLGDTISQRLITHELILDCLQSLHKLSSWLHTTMLRNIATLTRATAVLVHRLGA
jgi:hypothetical protein